MRISGMDAANASFTIGTGSAEFVNDVEYIPQRSRPSDSQPQQNNSKRETDLPFSDEMVSDAVDKINKMLEGTNRRCVMSVHDRTKAIIVKVVDDRTNEVVREIPPKKILDVIANMMELAGLIVDERR